MKKSLIYLIVLMNTIVLEAQVGIYPEKILIDPNSHSASMTIFNKSSKMMEVNITFKPMLCDKSSYPLLIDWTDSMVNDTTELRKNLRILPGRFVIQPNSEQVTRFLIEQPERMTGTDYVAKLFICSRENIEGSGSVPENGERNKHEEITTIITYKPVKVQGEITISEIYSFEDDNYINLIFKIKQSLNNTFWGNAVIDIFNEAGEEIAGVNEPVTFNIDMIKRIKIEKNKFASGLYKAIITINSDRKDIPQAYLTKMQPVTKEYHFGVHFNTAENKD